MDILLTAAEIALRHPVTNILKQTSLLLNCCLRYCYVSQWVSSEEKCWIINDNAFQMAEGSITAFVQIKKTVKSFYDVFVTIQINQSRVPYLRFCLICMQLKVTESVKKVKLISFHRRHLHCGCWGHIPTTFSNDRFCPNHLNKNPPPSQLTIKHASEHILREF